MPEMRFGADGLPIQAIRCRAVRLWLVIIAVAISASCKAAAGGSTSMPTAVPLPARVTGANIRAVGDRRRGYGTPKARETMKRLSTMGVNTISVLMEGRMDDLDDTVIRVPDSDELGATRAILRDANKLGFATVLIPHLYLDDGAWRGLVRPKTVQARDAWWASYDKFIDVAAALAEDSGVTVLSIGVELKAISASPDTYRRMKLLRDRVRRTFRGELTYSANWDEAEQVLFWDLVDLAGVNGYYPLQPDPVRGAEKIGRRLTDLCTLAGRDVLVLEVGFRASPLSHVEPWAWPEDVGEQVDQGAQAQAWAAVLSYWLDAPGVRGLLLWVIPTDPDDPASEAPHGFNPLNKQAEQVIRSAFLGAQTST